MISDKSNFKIRLPRKTQEVQGPGGGGDWARWGKGRPYNGLNVEVCVAQASGRGLQYYSSNITGGGI